jgi:DNA gyrase/topoisomerase IV subunit B
LDDATEADSMFSRLMGDDSDLRKAWLIEKAAEMKNFELA